MVSYQSPNLPVLQVPLRFYQIARLYGPGMPASGVEGWHNKVLQKPVRQVGVVAVHCWNLGEPDGPYPVDEQRHYPGEVADWVPVAHEIVAHRIRPVFDAARRAGVHIFHLAHPVYANRYPQYKQVAADPDLAPPWLPRPVPGCVRPWTVQDGWRDEYGEGFPGAVWESFPDKFDIASVLRPVAGDSVVTDGWQLNGLCRRMDIDTLFYVGFMADLCLLNIRGAMREMVNLFRYHCIVLRDCTTAYEFADTYEGQWMNHAVIRLIETDLGHSAVSADFISACIDALPDGQGQAEQQLR